ncbi:DeoR-family transcriptional regulator [Sulfobacillus acidophilus TPY]|nr:DeoR-family transcriptional regulator [Sulfobacillus acidophilus TPY]
MILELLKTRGPLTLTELASYFECSTATIRRDILALERLGDIRRFHGAVALSGVTGPETSFRENALRFASEKTAIGRILAEWIPEDAIVGLNGGTTTTSVAKQLLAARRRVTVVTNAVNIAHLLSDGGIDVVVIGGAVSPPNYETIGPIAIQSLVTLHLDIVVLGANGVDPRFGVTTTTEQEAAVGRAFAERSDRVIIAADHSKLNRNSLFQMLEWNQVDDLATDSQSVSVVAGWAPQAEPLMTYEDAVLYHLRSELPGRLE